MKYDYKAVEAKWQKTWEDEKTFHVEIDHSKPKFYALVEFPYPSGAGLHVGHPRPFTAMDIICRKKRMQGYNVLFPIGFDAFGCRRRTLPSRTTSIPPSSRSRTSRTSPVSSRCSATASTGTA